MLWRSFLPTMMATAVVSTLGFAVGAHAEPMTIGFSMPDLSEILLGLAGLRRRRRSEESWRDDSETERRW